MPLPRVRNRHEPNDQRNSISEASHFTHTPFCSSEPHKNHSQLLDPPRDWIRTGTPPRRDHRYVCSDSCALIQLPLSMPEQI